jgi:NTE family protein
VCLVLSGGGARGLAHIGVLRAFADAGIAVDVIAGTSMGAMIAGMVALDHQPEQIAAECRRIFRRKAISDYTVPVIAVMRGRRFSRLLGEIIGDARIENLWRNFFCVSVNLSRGEQHLHKSGPLLEALRASAAVPGIMPPIVRDGNILVDGGIMNNLPVGEMSSLSRGVVIGADVTSDWLLKPKDLDADLDIADKSLLWLLSKGRKASPNILNVLGSSAAVSGGLRTLAGRAEADLLIQPELGAIDWSAFHEFDRIVELGYNAAVDAIPRIKQ